MQSTPILPGIQPPGHHAAGSRPDGPPFASSLEEAGISLTSEVTAPASRDSGAAESALDHRDESRSDSGHSPVSMRPRLATMRTFQTRWMLTMA